MVRFARDPLVHFLLAGLGLFMLYALVNPSVDEGRVIRVDRPALLGYIQRDAKRFDPVWAEKAFVNLSEDDVRFLVERHVWDEVLYREALEKGLERDDDGVRELLVKKMEFIAMSAATTPETISDEGVEVYFEENKADYYVEPQISFTHVFYSYANHGIEGAEKEAAVTLAVLKAGNVTFEGARDYGEPSELHQSYIGASTDIVGGHFGGDMAETVFSLKTPLNQWIGPYDSLQGVHLVLITKREAGRDALLTEVPWARKDALDALIWDMERAQVEDLISQYDVREELAQ